MEPTTINKPPVVLFILGATCSGKTRFSKWLKANKITNFEVVNADERQIYKGQDIIADLPTDYYEDFPHHLYAFEEPRRVDFTPKMYKKLAIKTIDEILERGNLPMIIGNTADYIQKLLYKKKTDNREVIQMRYFPIIVVLKPHPTLLQKRIAKRFEERLGSIACEALPLIDKVLRENDDVLKGGCGILNFPGLPQFFPLFKEQADLYGRENIADSAEKLLHAEEDSEILKQCGKALTEAYLVYMNYQSVNFSELLAPFREEAEKQLLLPTESFDTTQEVWVPYKKTLTAIQDLQKYWKESTPEEVCKMLSQVEEYVRALKNAKKE